MVRAAMLQYSDVSEKLYARHQRRAGQPAVLAP